MHRFFDTVIFDNRVGDYLVVVGVILAVFLLRRFISHYIALLLTTLFERAWRNFDKKKFIELIIHPLSLFLLVTVSFITLYKLTFPSVLNIQLYKLTLKQVLEGLLIIVQLLVFTWLMLRVIDYIAQVLETRAQRNVDPADNQLIVFFRDFLKVLIGIVGFILILKFAFGYRISSLLTGLSIVGAAIALALRESLENLIASFVIFFDKPFTTGDTVKVQQITGVVEKIGLRSTRIRSEQKTYITVPNKQMVDTILDNHSLRTMQKNELKLQLNLKTSAVQLNELSNRILDYLKKVREVTEPRVYFLDIQEDAFQLHVEYFVPPAYLAIFNELKQNLNFFVLQTLEEMQLKIAGQDKVVVLSQP